MRVKLDEHLGLATRQLLRDRGHDVQRVTDEGISGSPDEILWKHVCKEERLLITLDLDFSDRRKFPPGSHPGIVLLRPRNSSNNAVMQVLRRLLMERKLESLTGCLSVADEYRTRIYGLSH